MLHISETSKKPCLETQRLTAKQTLEEKKLNNSSSSKRNIPQFETSPLELRRNRAEVGVLLASHGDIDALREVSQYIRTAYLKNDAIPLPAWLRKLTLEPAFLATIGVVADQYVKIGPTHYRENTKKQTDALTNLFAKQNLPARAYAGFNFTEPFLSTTLAKMQADGVKKIVLINQGAQFSFATNGENIKDVKEYLHKHPEWNVDVVVVNQFSSDERFRALLAKSILRDVKRAFPQASSDQVCVLLGSHGLPLQLIENGDPAVKQMQSLVDDLRKRLPQLKLYHGYLNDDFFPGAKWVSPEASEVAEDIKNTGYQHVLLDGRLSFTVHHRATLYDLDKIAREKLTEPSSQSSSLNPTGTSSISRHRIPDIDVKLAPNFDGDPEFANYLSILTREALQGKGDISVLRKRIS